MKKKRGNKNGIAKALQSPSFQQKIVPDKRRKFEKSIDEHIAKREKEGWK